MLIGLVAVCILLLAGVVVANMFGGGRGPVADNWSPPPPDMNPSELPSPETYAEATEWLEKNPFYQQSITIPTNCTEMQPLNAQNTTLAEADAHLLKLTSCLLRVWQAPVQAAGYQMPRPPATAYNGTGTNACGKLVRANAQYCGADQRIYYSLELPMIMPPELRNQKFLIEVVLGHEFAHAIQARTGILISGIAWEQRATTKAAANVFARRLELQADCLSGMWTRAVADSQGLNANDLAALGRVAYNIGDDVLTGKPNIDEGHGLGATRQRWFELGADGNPSISKCNAYTVPDDQVR